MTDKPKPELSPDIAALTELAEKVAAETKKQRIKEAVSRSRRKSVTARHITKPKLPGARLSKQQRKRKYLDELPPHFSINGVHFEPIPGVRYPHNYQKIVHDIATKRTMPDGTTLTAEVAFKSLCISDPWFILYFVMGYKTANHPFVIEAAKDVMNGPASLTLDVWSREHFKSSLITVAQTVCDILRNPEERIGIFSYKLDAAEDFVTLIRRVLESPFLYRLFPDVLYQDPQTETKRSGKAWANGSFQVKRKSLAKEATVEGYGLVESMPTGRHFTKMIFDDVETERSVTTPEQIKTLRTAFYLAQSLGAEGGTQRVIGTYYHHDGLLTQLGELRDDETSQPLYHLRLKPATEDGTPTGKLVLLSEERVRIARKDAATFNTQYLCNPTPPDSAEIKWSNVTTISPSEIPERLFKFMVVDPSGSKKQGIGDAWACWVVGVKPNRDALGLSEVYLLDGFLEPMPFETALDRVAEVYLRNGRILQVGIEKVSQTTFEVHIANRLAKDRVHLSVDAGNLFILSPKSRQKVFRIVSALAWPVNNGKLFISSAVEERYRDRLKLESERLGKWHDDGLDALSYLYDMLTEYRFGEAPPPEREKTWWEKALERKANSTRNRRLGWMGV